MKVLRQKDGSLGGGGLQPKKKTEDYRKFQIWDWFFGFFFRFFFSSSFFFLFSVFLDFSILAKFDWSNGFLLVIIAFIRHLQGFIGIVCY